MGVCHDLSYIVFCVQDLPGEFIEAQSFGAGQLNNAVDGIAERDVGEGRGDVVRRDRLKQRGRQSGDCSSRTGIDDSADEFEPLVGPGVSDPEHRSQNTILQQRHVQ